MNKAEELKTMFFSDVDTLLSQPEFFAKDPLTYFAPNNSSPKGHNEIHVTAAYQIFDRIYTDAVIQPSPQKNEFHAFCNLVDRCNVSKGIPLFICDMGFTSYNAFAHCFEKDVCQP